MKKKVLLWTHLIVYLCLQTACQTSTKNMAFNSRSPASVYSNLTGNIDGIVTDSAGNSFIHGWACIVGNNDPVTVHVYANSGYPEGKYLTTAIANLKSESAVAQVCQTNASNYRFSIPLSHQLRSSFANASIYIHGMNNYNNPLLYSSGSFKIPALQTSGENKISQNPWNVRVGAIRWDAWMGDSFAQPKVTESLSPKEFWPKLPFFSEIRNDTLQPINGNNQQVMENEINYAARAGIDYWAFVEYPKGYGLDGMENAFDLYMRSSNTTVKFSLIMGIFTYDLALDTKETVKWIQTETEKLLDPRYETVLNGRPLVYVFDDICSETYRKKYCSPWFFDKLSESVQNAKGVKPYYVYLTWSAAYSGADAKYLGMDALSTYAMAPGSRGFPGKTADYTDFANEIRMNFEYGMRLTALKENLDVVPFASAGWDPTPRLKCGSNCWGDSYSANSAVTVNLSGSKIAAHIQSVAEWTAYHGYPQDGSSRATSPARTMLIYAWNEYDEGGWLAPTLSSDLVNPDTSRVDALQKVLRP